MPAYTPFLIPLFPESVEPADSPLSPIEEEEAILGPGDRRPDWALVAERCRAAYGLPLITELPKCYRCEKMDRLENAVSPFRALHLYGEKKTWFVLETPDALTLFDRFAEEGQRASLIRPLLFARLWRESQTARTRKQLKDTEAGEASGIHALERYLGEVLPAGNPSDWHLEPVRSGYLSRFRIHGKLSQGELLSRDKGRWLMQSFLATAGMKPRVDTVQDGRLDLVPGGRSLSLRLSFIPAQHGISLVVRFLYPEQECSFQLDQLGFAGDLLAGLRKAYSMKEGLWLLAGPTGSGKSTTLHAFLRESVQKKEKILAVEDPVERTIQGVHHLSIHSPPGLTYATAARAFLRQSPDCVMIGEIRDSETAAIAVQAARTGHRILSTVHARNDAGLFRRFEDLGQKAEAVGQVLSVALHQRLVPLLCRKCRIRKSFPEAISAIVLREGLDPPRYIAEENGCQDCHAGIQGRQALFSTGRMDFRGSMPEGLREEAWSQFSRERISVKSLLAYLPPDLRRHFQICQP